MARIIKGDLVQVLTGKDKGKKGEVIAVMPKKGRVVVKDVAVVFKHSKAKRQGEVSAIKKKEASIDLSNIAPVCRSCDRVCRVGVVFVDTAGSGGKVRVCKRCGQAI